MSNAPNDHRSRRKMLAKLGLLIALSGVFAGCLGRGAPKLFNNPLDPLRKNNQSKLGNPDYDPLDPMGARSVNRLVLHDLAPNQIGNTFNTHGRRQRDQKAAEAAMDEGQRLYRQAVASIEAENESGDAKALFEQAAKKFRFAGSRWPNSALEQDALFYEAESQFFADRYVQANRTFEKLISIYSGTRYMDKAQARRFSIAQYWLSLARSNRGWSKSQFAFLDPARPAYSLAAEARRLFHRIRLEDPTGKLADDASMALANAYFEAQMYQDAADTYEDLRRTYPGSKFVYDACMMELKSRLNSYYGESYDASPLIKADALLKQMVAQFPNLPDEDRQVISREASAVRNLLAERDYTLGQYYERRNENRAATIMYASVANNYQETEVAELAESRLNDVRDKEPLPPERAQWLVELFPKSEASKPLIASGDKESMFR